MDIAVHRLATLYRRSHDLLRNIDGLQPQEALDELLKYLYFKQNYELLGQKAKFSNENSDKSIRSKFADYIKCDDPWLNSLWKDKKIHLSKNALLAIHTLFETVEFNQLSFDIRSSALKEFLPPEIRRGLGIFLTPDDVVRMMVEFVEPIKGQKIYDPACGSGTFLIEAIKELQKANIKAKTKIYGSDINPRMLILAELNLNDMKSIQFNRQVHDAFTEPSKKLKWLKSETFDIILTNPPFGVILKQGTHKLHRFTTTKKPDGSLLNRQQSEIVFIEQALKLLRPGGILAIVVPRSIITNRSLAFARSAINQLGYVYAAVMLPPETFQGTGTQISTAVLFIKKYFLNEEKNGLVNIALSDVTNVGFDSTGRPRNENQLHWVAKSLKNMMQPNNKTSSNFCQILTSVKKCNSLGSLAELITGSSKEAITGETRLKDITLLVRTGNTPPRSNYSDNGLFIIKVGNLSNNGINWASRDRNFVNAKEAAKRLKNANKLIVQNGDILLTSSAHSPIYIAKKVDIITEIPQWVGAQATFVGEVMLIRPDKAKVDPYALLAYLRSPIAMSQIQKMIRGQTAHLHPDDLLELEIPHCIFKKSRTLIDLIKNTKEQTLLSDQLNELIYNQTVMIQNFFKNSNR